MNRIALTGIFVVGIATISMAQSFSSALDYLNFFTNEHLQINAKNMEYLQHAVHTEDINLVESKRQALIKQIDQSLMKTQSIEPFADDSEMVNGMQTVLNDYKKLFENEFKEVNILKSNSNDSFEALEAYFDAVEAAENKIQESSEAFRDIQKAYAKANQIQLVESGADNIILELNQLNSYYRNIFKRFFRINKLNNEFTQAMNSQDVDAMKKAHQDILEAAQQESKSLQSIPPFKEDASYRDVALEYVKYTQEIATKNYPAVINALQKQEDGSVLGGEAVNAYNETVQKLNSELGPLTSKVPLAGNELLKKHVPKPIKTKKI